MKKTILISNRDDQEVDSLSAFFHKIGYRVETARLLVDMLNKVRSTNIQVLLLDDEIEGVKAWDLIPLVKKIKPWLQVIMISSEGVHRLGEAPSKSLDFLSGNEAGRFRRRCVCRHVCF